VALAVFEPQTLTIHCRDASTRRLWAVFRSMRSLDRLRSEIGRRDGSNLSQIPESRVKK
jgi:hypothetical protein